ncbi:hypothetical protein [Leptolyngbya sp. 7M]|uniref:hypothetical protein n=1 Tax=Leptolyngbya sp. 7M TaxID=2812896 RepID=UPI001B8A8F3B|nr:hypothetical protein [Leptolyngbya sp. 7M]QYO65079.1 hypothetical protein JVX88_37180 [Leptolyngbya sp. 7M]
MSASTLAARLGAAPLPAHRLRGSCDDFRFLLNGLEHELNEPGLGKVVAAQIAILVGIDDLLAAQDLKMLRDVGLRDPEERQITLCQWVDGAYEDTVVRGSNRIPSGIVPEFKLTVEQVLGIEE